jgi:hypothetical protein
MSHPKAQLRCRFAGVLAGALLWAAGVFAQPHNSSVWGTNETPGLTVTFQAGEHVGQQQVIRGLIRSGTNTFMFVLPEGVRAETSSEGRIVLTSWDVRYFLCIGIVGPPLAEPGLKEALRQRIASHYPNARNLEEFAATVADREGTGFQLRQALPGVGDRLIRIVWVPFRAGLLEFTLNADSGSASAGQGTIDMILLTFRSDERGKIEIVRRSENT